ncbi:MAG: HigA family addiction module antitoxin [Gammaproteobacteria bacterium]
MTKKPNAVAPRCPTHPGKILREDVLPSLNITVTDAAKELGIARQTLHRVMTGEMAISPAMALRLGRWCGNGPGLWLRMQIAYDLWHAERAMGDSLVEIPSHVAA